MQRVERVARRTIENRVREAWPPGVDDGRCLWVVIGAAVVVVAPMRCGGDPGGQSIAHLLDARVETARCGRAQDLKQKGKDVLVAQINGAGISHRIDDIGACEFSRGDRRLEAHVQQAAAVRRSV